MARSFILRLVPALCVVVAGCGSPGGGGGGPVPAPSPSPTTAPLSVAPVASPSPARAVSFATDVAPAVSQNCAVCHNGQGEAWSMIDSQGQPSFAAISPNVARMVAMVSAGAMPPGRSGASVAPVLATLKAWQAEGAPNN